MLEKIRKCQTTFLNFVLSFSQAENISEKKLANMRMGIHRWVYKQDITLYHQGRLNKQKNMSQEYQNSYHGGPYSYFCNNNLKSHPVILVKHII